MMHAVIVPRRCARSGSVTATAISLYSPVRDGMGFLRAAARAVPLATRSARSGGGSASDTDRSDRTDQAALHYCQLWLGTVRCHRDQNRAAWRVGNSQMLNGASPIVDSRPSSIAADSRPAPTSIVRRNSAAAAKQTCGKEQPMRKMVEVCLCVSGAISGKAGVAAQLELDDCGKSSDGQVCPKLGSARRCYLHDRERLLRRFRQRWAAEASHRAGTRPPHPDGTRHLT